MNCKNQNTIRAGRIVGSALQGLCERVCIQTKRVLDGCRQNLVSQTFDASINTEGLVAPIKFVEARQSGNVEVSALSITPLENQNAQYSFSITIPLSITVEEANGNKQTLTSSTSLNCNVVLKIPTDSLLPYDVEVSTALRATIGSVSDNGAVTFTTCIVIITRLTTIVELLVPTYGYCEYPICDGGEDRVCMRILTKPIYPQ